MQQPTIRKPQGILRPQKASQMFQLDHYYPSSDLAFFIERYWLIRWDLRGRPPFVQETLPYPCVNLVFEDDDAGTAIFGVCTGKFTRRLEGQGQVFGVKFRAGAFYPFLRTSVTALTNTTLKIDAIFDIDVRLLQREVFSHDDDAERVRVVEDFLMAHLPPQDDSVIFINRVIDRVVDDRAITRVDDIAAVFAVSARTLQRLFRRYVGVSPKWVIQRYRLHEAADQLASGAVTDWTTLALSLGYFDQAHFINDFKNIVGQTPAEYATSAREEI